jgi:hypothetical protein
VFNPAQNERPTPTSLPTLGRTASWLQVLSGGCPAFLSVDATTAADVVWKTCNMKPIPTLA